VELSHNPCQAWYLLVSSQLLKQNDVFVGKLRHFTKRSLPDYRSRARLSVGPAGAGHRGLLVTQTGLAIKAQATAPRFSPNNSSHLPEASAGIHPLEVSFRSQAYTQKCQQEEFQRSFGGRQDHKVPA
jgi:hypothetical protein